MLIKKQQKVYLYLSLLSFTLLITLASANKKLPIVGILSNPETGSDKNSTKYHINANFVRWLESNGMEAIAIHPYYSEGKLSSILQKLNGVVLQGENFDFDKESIYFKTSKSIIEKVKSFDKNPNMNLPIFGVCSGFQVIQTVLAETDILTFHPHIDSASSLIFEEDELKDSKLFNGINDKFIKILKDTKSIYENHFMAVAPEQYSEKNKLKEYMNFHTTDKDSKGNSYVASAEGIKNYPFFGVQFRPEMVSYNRNRSRNVPETFESVLISKHFGHFLLKQASQNTNIFDNVRDDENYLTGKLPQPADKDGNYYYTFNKPTA